MRVQSKAGLWLLALSSLLGFRGDARAQFEAAALCGDPPPPWRACGPMPCQEGDLFWVLDGGEALDDLFDSLGWSQACSAEMALAPDCPNPCSPEARAAKADRLAEYTSLRHRLAQLVADLRLGDPGDALNELWKAHGHLSRFCREIDPIEGAGEREALRALSAHLALLAATLENENYGCARQQACRSIALLTRLIRHL